MITILGPTATGKTSLAVAVAAKLNTEIISGDSRQVYRRMDIGTGKDLGDYCYHGKYVPFHLIDVAEPGTKYTVYDFQRDFLKAYSEIIEKGIEPVFCGGSGLYLESVLRSYRLSPVPVNESLRESLKDKTLEELTRILSSYKELHNKTDVDTCTRAIRAIEIEAFYQQNPIKERDFPEIKTTVFGVSVSREVRRARISKRLRDRMAEGMILEVRKLIESGIKPEDMIYYGLEYKYLTLYLLGELSYPEMFCQLEIAIHQFSKRQMTWFRGMERRGVAIRWIDGDLPMEEKVRQILQLSGYQV
jgi:tRNA dimethylallyltransferase